MYRYPAPASSPERALHVLFVGVAFAAGVTGLVLLVFPATTELYFSWGLEPAPLAALIGGSYVASLIVFGHAARRPWREGLGLAMGTLALTLPMLVSTFTHLDTFDFSRWQSWGWVFLFLASPFAFGWVLNWGGAFRWTTVPRLRRPLVGVVAAILTYGAIALWADPTGFTIVPFDLPPLGGRVLGCWLSFLAFLSWWATFRADAVEVVIPLEAVTLFGIGALVAAARTRGNLGLDWTPYLVLWAVVTFVAALEWVRARRSSASVVTGDV